MLWNEGDEKYYPAGVDDEDYCVIEFIADEGRFYRYDGKGDISKTEIENQIADLIHYRDNLQIEDKDNIQRVLQELIPEYKKAVPV